MTLRTPSVVALLPRKSPFRRLLILPVFWGMIPLLSFAQQQVAIPLELRSPEKTVNIRADSQKKEGDLYRLSGHVEITYRDMRMTSDEATFDDTSGEVVAKGHITFTDPNAHFEADEAHYNVQTQKAWFTDGSGYVHARVRAGARILVTENPFYIRADKVERLDENTYSITKGHLTTCECEKKGWSVGVSKAMVQIDDRVVSRGGTLRLLRVPVFYSPYLVNSIARRPRHTGFLLPHIGNSSQKGLIVGDGFYWAINPSADLMGGAEYYSKRGWGRLARFRARPNSTSDLYVDYFGINDRGTEITQPPTTPGSPPTTEILRASGQSIRAIGRTEDLGFGFRGVLDVDYINSLAFRQTWSNTFAEAVASEVHQTGFMSKSVDAYSMNVYVSRYQNFLSTSTEPGNSVKIWQTPSLSISGMDKQIGNSPLFYSFEASAGGVGREEPGFRTNDLSERLDVHPAVLLRSRGFWGFHFTPSVGVRETYYGTSLTQGQDPINRLVGELGFDLRPPSFERVFSRPYRGRRFKHVVETDIQYHLVRVQDPKSVDDIVRFDFMDIFAQTNEVEYSLTNSILFRKDVPEGQSEKPQARELFSWRLTQKYYFDPTFGGALEPLLKNVFDPTISLTGFAFAQGRHLSPLVSVFKIAPFSNYDTELRADFGPNGGVLNAGITSHVRRGPLGLEFTDFFVNRTSTLIQPLAPSTPVSLIPSFHLFRIATSFGEVNRKGFSGAFGLDYNLAQKIAHQVMGQVSYNFGCFGIDIEYRRFLFGTIRNENQFRVALSFANIGTFGNLKSRERLYREEF